MDEGANKVQMGKVNSWYYWTPIIIGLVFTIFVIVKNLSSHVDWFKSYCKNSELSLLYTQVERTVISTTVHSHDMYCE